MKPTRFLSRWTPLLVTALAAGRVHADEDSDRDERARLARIDVEQFAHRVDDATQNGVFGSNNFFHAAAECTKAVQDGTAAGLRATDTFQDGAGNTVLWKHAPKVCDDYARLWSLARTVEALDPLLSTVRAWTGPDGRPHTSATGDAYRATVATVQPCLGIVDQALQDGVPGDVAFAVDGMGLVTLPQARKVCADYLGFGGAAAKADDARADAELTGLKATYGKLGITGDRLTYVIAYGHRPILGKGCGELTGKALKTAPAFYDLGQDDLAWIVYKTQWKGDKKIKYTQRRFRKDGDYQCK